MSHMNFNKATLAAALLATSALVAPHDVFAADISGAVTAAAATYIAPVTNAQAIATAGAAIVPVLGYSQKVALFEASAAEALGLATGAMKFKIFYFDASSTFLFADTGVSVTNGNLTVANAANGAILSVTGNTLAKKAAIVVQTANGTDTVGGTAAHDFGILNSYVSGTGATNMGYTVTDLGALSGLTATDANVAAAILTGPATGLISINSTYAGPVITSAGKPTDGAGSVKVVAYSSMPLAAIVQDIAVTVNFTATKTGGAAATNTLKTDTVAAGDIYLQLYKTPSTTTAFDDIITTLTPVYNATPVVKDLAGNGLALGQTALTVNVFAKPKLATVTAPVVISGLGTDSEANRAKLLAATLTDGNSTVKVTVRFAESISGASIMGAGSNFAISPAVTGTAITAAAASGTNAVLLTLTGSGGGANRWGVNASNQLTYGGSVVNITGASAGTQLANAAPNSQAWASASDATTGVPATAGKLGMAPAPLLATRDEGPTGLLNGATIDFGVPVGATPAASDFTLKTAFGGTARNIPFTVGKDGANKVKVLMTSASTADWNENATAAEAADTALYIATNFNTGLTGAGVKYTTAIVAAPTLTYTSIYDPSTGELGVVNSLTLTTLPATPTDGAKPLVQSATYQPVQGTSPAAGILKIVASEALTNTSFKASDFLFGGSPLSLVDLAQGVTIPTDGNVSGDIIISTTTTNNDTVTIGAATTAGAKVAATVAGTTMKFATAPGITDAIGAANQLSTVSAGVTVATGTTAFSAPKIVQATAVRDSSLPLDGAISQILVKFDKGVALSSGGVMEDGMFQVMASLGGETSYTVNVPATSVTTIAGTAATGIDMTSATTGYVTLNIPAPGIKATALTDLAVNYNPGAAATAKLVSTDSVPTDVANNVAVNTTTAAGGLLAQVNNDDYRHVNFTQGSGKLYTMEVSGKLTSDGTTVAPAGSIVRVDLVEIAKAPAISTISVNLPCGCTSVTSQVTVASGAASADYIAVATQIKNDRKLGKTSTNAFILADVSAAGVNALTSATIKTVQPVAAAVATQKVYPITIDTTTGAIAGVGGVTGTATIVDQKVLQVDDTVYSTTASGIFRASVGINAAPTGTAFLMASVRQMPSAVTTSTSTLPTQYWKLFTSPVPAFSNYVPFASNVTASGTIGGSLGTIDLSKVNESSATTATTYANGWQLLGLTGALSITTDATRKTQTNYAERLGISVDINGNPVTAYAYNDDHQGDQFFTLINNTSGTALQLLGANANQTAAYIDTIAALNGGYGLAWNENTTNKYGVIQLASGTVGAATVIARTSAPTTTYTSTGQVPIATATPFKIFYPVTTQNSPAIATTAGTWSLLTMDAAKSSTDLATWATTNKVGAIIIVGGGNVAKTWFASPTDSNASVNTLTSLAAGDRAFVYFSAANSAFAFGR